MGGLNGFGDTERTLSLRGNEFKVKKLGFLKVHAEAEQVVVKGWTSRISKLLDVMPEDQKNRLSDKAYEDVKRGATMDDTVTWIYSTEGLTHVLHMAIRDNHPDVTLSDVEAMLEELEPDEIVMVRQAVDHVQGIEVNPSQPPEETTGQTPDQSDQSTGDESSG